MSFVQTLVAFLAALTLLVFVHELGHYLVARWCGVKVLRFSVGFGRPLLTWRVGPDRTEWCLSAIPLGGYVKMLDERETPTAQIPPAELSRAFTRQSLRRRAAIVSAGPLANFLLAIAIYCALNLIGTMEPAAVLGAPAQGSAAQSAGLAAGDRVVAVDGRDVRSWNEVRMRLLDGVVDRREIPVTVERDAARVTFPLDPRGLPAGEIERDFVGSLGLGLAFGRVVVSSVADDGAAARAGLRVGDEVVSVDGRPVGGSRELIEVIRASAERPLPFVVLRDGAEVTVPVTPQARVSDRPEDAGRAVGRIGAGLSNRVAMTEVRHGPLESVGLALHQTWDMSIFSLRMLGKMLTGELSWRNLSGPVSIADYAGQSARVGWFAYASFLALISISLGVLNLLPIPVLDGGHLVYYGLEALKGRPLSERFMDITQRAGLFLVAAMMFIALFNDLTRLFGS